MDWRATLIDIFQVASILSAATFAALALFTDYKKDGKVTKYGRIAVAGIVLSAVFSLGTRWVQAILAEEAAAEALAEREKENRRFEQQMGGLQRLAADLGWLQARTERLNEGMDASREAQGLLLTSAGRSMLMTARLGAQERENTGRVLRGLWDEANRISSDTIELDLAYDCGARDGTRFPLLLAEGARAEVGLVPLAQATASGIAFKTFDSGRLLREAIVLTSVEQRVAVHPKGMLGPMRRQYQTSRFSAFYGPELERLAQPEQWTDLAAEVVVTALQPDLVDRMRGVVGLMSIGGKGALSETYEISPRVAETDYQVGILESCTASMALIVNDRTVAQSRGRIVQVRESASDKRGLVVVKFFITAVKAQALPQYAGAAQADDPGREPIAQR